MPCPWCVAKAKASLEGLLFRARHASPLRIEERFSAGTGPFLQSDPPQPVLHRPGRDSFGRKRGPRAERGRAGPGAHGASGCPTRSFGAFLHKKDRHMAVFVAGHVPDFIIFVVADQPVRAVPEKFSLGGLVAAVIQVLPDLQFLHGVVSFGVSGICRPAKKGRAVRRRVPVGSVAKTYLAAFSASSLSSRSQTPSIYWMPRARSYLP